MKRILVWILILQFATGHNLLAELMRVSPLLEHYQTHRQETPDLSFARFLWLHYLETSHTHSDNSHAQLPLHCSHGILAESLMTQPPVFEFLFDASASESSSHPLHDEMLWPNDYTVGLFRPPIA